MKIYLMKFDQLLLTIVGMVRILGCSYKHPASTGTLVLKLNRLRLAGIGKDSMVELLPIARGFHPVQGMI